VESLLFPLARQFSPRFDEMTRQEQAYVLSNLVGFLYSAPLALIGLVWLTAYTDFTPLRQVWPILLVVAGLVLLFRQLDFFTFTEVKTGLYADWGGTLDTIAIWSGALILGAVAFWPGLLFHILTFVIKARGYAATELLLTRLRKLSLDLANESLLGMIALFLYGRLGGTFPIGGLGFSDFLPAILTILSWYVLSSLLWAPYFFMAFLPPSVSLPRGERLYALQLIARLYGITEILPALLSPYAVLSAGLYGQYGLVMYLVFQSGLILPAILANQLSEAAERGYHRTRELERLDRLSTDIIDAPSDASTLPDLLEQEVPGMFPDSQVEVRIFPETILLRSSKDYPPVPETAWEWISHWPKPEPVFFLRGEIHPWGNRPDDSSYIIAPIFNLSSGDLIGGICVMVRWWPNKIIPYFMPAVQSLAALVSSTLHQAEVTAQMLLQERVAQELLLAGEIQKGLIPQDLPALPGWKMAAALEPSRETSGDFYDAIPLPSGKLGVVVADVADKGIGAALYMTLSRTLIRSYAIEHEHRPDLVMRAVNQRLLVDSNVEMFVTVFYGVIDPVSGRLDYCNAGHTPPYLIKPGGEGILRLKNTGMALGVLEEAPLQRASVLIDQGALFLLYTDGITDTQNENGEFYEEERMLEVLRACQEDSIENIRDALLQDVHNFAGDAPQVDDITLMIIQRERMKIQ
jgi:serine phosphatase RsbU (regulator of sigma subunit)